MYDFKRTNSILVARSLDYHTKLDTAIKFVPRNTDFKSLISYNGKPVSWSSKYKFIQIVVHPKSKKNRYPMEGINEKGLSIALLGLKKTEYPKLNKRKNNICIDEFITWGLSQFDSVESLKKELNKYNIIGIYDDDISKVPGYHISIYDAFRDSLIIEFKHGKMKLYENNLGVLTNSSFLQISYDKEGKNESINRYFFINSLKNEAEQPKDLKDALVLGFNILGKVYFIKKKEKNTQDKYTQWTAVKDLKSKILYYSPNNIDLYKVNLNYFKNKSTTISTLKSAKLQKTNLLNIKNNF